MRIITDKDKRGLLVALRVFLRAVNGERLPGSAGIPLIEKALESGLSFDQLLNKGNWERAQEVIPSLSFADYIELLCDRRIDVRELRDEPLWHESANGFSIVAEAAHDFYLELSGNGGKWNIPSALVNLAKVIRSYGLQPVLSEKLILEVLQNDPNTTYFNYILAIVNDFNTLSIETAPTQWQERREQEDAEAITETCEDPDGASGENENEDVNWEEHGLGDENEEDSAPEDTPYPDPEEEQIPGFESVIVAANNPNEMKKACLRTVLGNFSPNELLGLIRTIDGGMDLTLDDIVTKLANGQFDPKAEDVETRRIHQEINSSLIISFVDCVHMQNREMDEETAAEYDILHESWDLRTPEVRKLHKLLKLIYTQGKDDPDLLDAVSDIEQLYTEDKD